MSPLTLPEGASILSGAVGGPGFYQLSCNVCGYYNDLNPTPMNPMTLGGDYTVRRSIGEMKRRSVPGLVVATGAILAAVLMSAASVARPVPAGPLWAVGHTENFRTEHILGPLVERFHGGSWHRVSIPAVAGGALDAVAALGPTDAWAVGGVGEEGLGHTLTLHWNGSLWSRVPSPSPTGGDALEGVSAVSANDVWAVGRTGRSEVGGPPLILRWDGTGWKEVPTSVSGALLAVHALSVNDVWAVGYSVHGVSYHTLVLHWDGSAWKQVPSASPGNYDQLAGVAATAPSNVWAVGWVGTRRPRTLIEHWNGSAWKWVSSPSPGIGDFLASVAVVSPRNVWAVGETSDRASVGNLNTLIERWNGSSWSRVASPTPAGGNLGALFLTGVVAVSPSNVWAVGSYDTGRAWLTMAEHWNGLSWRQVTTASPSSANYLNGVG